MTGAPATRARRPLGVGIALAGAAIALGLFYLLYRNIDLAKFTETLWSVRPQWLAVLVVAILVENLLRGWKWGQILRDLKPVPTLHLFGAIMAGYAANLLAPVGVSPLVRSWVVARLSGLRFASVLVTAMIARFVDGVAFAFLAFLAALAVAEYVPGLRIGLAAGGAANLLVFGGLLGLLFWGRDRLGQDGNRASRMLDSLARLPGRRFDKLRLALREGIVWPHSKARQAGIAAASVVVKLLAAGQILSAGLAVGVGLGPVDSVLVTVTAGIGLILGRLVRVPGGFTLGAGFALSMIGVPEATALALILLRNSLTVGLNVTFGVGFLSWTGLRWRGAGEHR